MYVLFPMNLDLFVASCIQLLTDGLLSCHDKTASNVFVAEVATLLHKKPTASAQERRR